MNYIVDELENITKKFRELMDSPEGKIVIETGAAVSGALNPIAGIFAEAGKSIAEESDKIKLNYIVKGLFEGINVETRMYELLAFAKDPEKAFLVSNTFRRALLSHSPIVCCIYGLILSDCIEGGRSISYEELIVYNALQTATDYEILYLQDILDHYLDGKDVDENRIDKHPNANCYQMTIDWCKSNRILTVSPGVRTKGGFDLLGDYLIINECTNKLANYIKRAHQITRIYMDYTN